MNLELWIRVKFMYVNKNRNTKWFSASTTLGSPLTEIQKKTPGRLPKRCGGATGATAGWKVVMSGEEHWNGLVWENWHWKVGGHISNFTNWFMFTNCGLWLVYDWFMIGLWLVYDWLMFTHNPVQRGPQTIAKVVNDSNFTNWFMIHITCNEHSLLLGLKQKQVF